jgi:hypothetical protein
MCFSSNDRKRDFNEMRHVTPTEFESSGKSEFTINISPLAGLARDLQSIASHDVRWCKIKAKK